MYILSDKQDILTSIDLSILFVKKRKDIYIVVRKETLTGFTFSPLDKTSRSAVIAKQSDRGLAYNLYLAS